MQYTTMVVEKTVLQKFLKKCCYKLKYKDVNKNKQLTRKHGFDLESTRKHFKQYCLFLLSFLLRRLQLQLVRY